jgi:hypothetical protein
LDVLFMADYKEETGKKGSKKDMPRVTDPINAQR